eukprot:3459105-Alexandrium_andersonii.AAC.1
MCGHACLHAGSLKAVFLKVPESHRWPAHPTPDSVALRKHRAGGRPTRLRRRSLARPRNPC